MTTSNHHAAIAVKLAAARPFIDRALVGRILERTGTPLALYTLARVLRAAATN